MKLVKSSDLEESPDAAGPDREPETPARTIRSAPEKGRLGLRLFPMLVMPVPVPSVKFAPVPRSMVFPARTSRTPVPLI